MRNRQDFAIAKTDEPVAQTRFRLVMGKARRALPSGRKPRRKFIEAVNSRNFFDEIDFALDFGAPGRLRAFPSGEEGAFRAAVVVDSNGRETQRAETGFNLFVGDVGAHHAENFRGALAGIDVNNTGEQFAVGKLHNQFSGAARGNLGHFGIGSAAEARGSFGVQFQETRGAANGDRFEPGAFDQDIFRGKGDFRFGAAHDSADSDGARAVAIADQAEIRSKLAVFVRRELPLDTVEGSHFLGWLGAADDNFVVANLVVIESVQRVAEFQHHVIRNIDHVADAGDARSFEAVFQPFWRRLDLDVSNDARGEAATKFRGLNFHFYGVAYFRRTLGRLGRDML